MKEKKADLKREIGFLGLSANIINTIIGAGIFILPAIVAARMGSASVLAYVFCGILVTLIMLCFAELGSKITDTGGTYIYIEKTFGKYPGFLAAILLLFANIAGTAAVANAIVEIIFNAFPAINTIFIKILFLLFLFSGLGYVNFIGIRKGVGLVKLITIFKLAPLLLLVFIGFKDVSISNLYWESFPSFQQIGNTSLILFFAFTGTEHALSISGEVRQPHRTIPRAILFSALIVTVMYILIQTVSQGVLGSSLSSFSDNPLAEVANQIAGPIGFTIITIGAAVSMFGNVSSKVLSTPRVFFAASKDMVFPIKILSKIHVKYNTPHIAIIVYIVLCFTIASLGGFRQLAIIASAASLLLTLGISIAVIKLRRDKKNFDSKEKTFKIPGGYTVPILSSITTIWFLSNLSGTKALGLGAFIILITILYFLINFKNNLSKK